MNEFLKNCRKLKPHEIVKILEDHRKLYGTLTSSQIPQKTADKSILISIKIPESLLTRFKSTCAQKNLRYQSQIKILMKAWLESND